VTHDAPIRITWIHQQLREPELGAVIKPPKHEKLKRSQGIRETKFLDFGTPIASMTCSNSLMASGHLTIDTML
jgi:hypothetical protein